MSHVVAGLTSIIATLPKWTLGVNCFGGLEQAPSPPRIPKEAVFVSVYDGKTKLYRGLAGHHGMVYAQVLVRGMPKAVTTAQADAAAIWTLIRDSMPTPTIAKPAEFRSIRPLQSEPIQLKDGSSDMPRFAFSVSVMVDEGV